MTNQVNTLEQFASTYNDFLIAKAQRLASFDEINMNANVDIDKRSSSVISKFNANNPLVFSQSQWELIKKISKFLQDTESDVFLMKGYAGTGKTTILGLIQDYLIHRFQLSQAPEISTQTEIKTKKEDDDEGNNNELTLNFGVFAPTGRAVQVLNQITANKCCKTIHRGIYNTPSIPQGLKNTENFDRNLSNIILSNSKNDNLSIRKLEYFISDLDNRRKYNVPINEYHQHDFQDKIFIFDEASMIGNNYSELSEFRFGTGHLLDDIIKFTGVGKKSNHKHKIIFCGDPAQLFPVGMCFSPALKGSHLLDTYQLKTDEYELNQVLRQNDESGILFNATTLRQAIQKNNYSTLEIQEANDVIIITDSKESHKKNSLPNWISSFLANYRYIDDELVRIFIAISGNKINSGSEVITYSNHEAYELNQRIRKYLHPYEKNALRALEIKDKLIVTQNAYVQGEIFVSNGSFVLVDEIFPEHFIITEHISIKNDQNRNSGEGKDGYAVEYVNYSQQKDQYEVKLEMQKVRLKKGDYENKVILFDCWILLNDLKTTEPELSQLEVKAIQSFIRKYGPKEDENTGKANSYKMEQAICLQEALRVRYGYAITCHKSQGNEWDNVFIYALNRRGGSEELFHWFYTAITRARKNLFVIDPISLGKFNNIQILTSHEELLRQQEIKNKALESSLLTAKDTSLPEENSSYIVTDSSHNQQSQIIKQCSYSEERGQINQEEIKPNINSLPPIPAYFDQIPLPQDDYYSSFAQSNAPFDNTVNVIATDQLMPQQEAPTIANNYSNSNLNTLNENSAELCANNVNIYSKMNKNSTDPNMTSIANQESQMQLQKQTQEPFNANNDYSSNVPIQISPDSSLDKSILNHYGILDPNSFSSHLLKKILQILQNKWLEVENVLHHQYQEIYKIRSTVDPNNKYEIAFHYNKKNMVSSIKRLSQPLPANVETAIMKLQGIKLITSQLDSQNINLTENEQEIVDFLRDIMRRVNATLEISDLKPYSIYVTLKRTVVNEVTGDTFEEQCEYIVYYNKKGVIGKVSLKDRGNAQSLIEDFQNMLAPQQETT